MRERLSDYQEEVRRSLQPGSHARPRSHDATAWPSTTCKRYPDIITADKNGETPVLHQQLPPARGLHGGHFLRAGHSGRAADAVHLRHGVPCLPRRKAARLARRRRRSCARSPRTTSLPYYTLSAPPTPSATDHGYITRRALRPAPSAASDSEVYSRITGYYRPRAELERRKAQEFQDRRVYNIGESKLTHEGPLDENERMARAGSAAQSAAIDDGAYLFATATCPNCRVACQLLDKAGVAYKKLLANENAELGDAAGRQAGADARRDEGRQGGKIRRRGRRAEIHFRNHGDGLNACGRWEQAPRRRHRPRRTGRRVRLKFREGCRPSRAPYGEMTAQSGGESLAAFSRNSAAALMPPLYKVLSGRSGAIPGEER